MVHWADPPDEQVVFVKAGPCSKNTGIMNLDGVEQASPHDICVDDDLMGGIRHCLPHTLVADIKSMFVVLGAPALSLRPCALALDKSKLLYIRSVQNLLDLT